MDFFVDYVFLDSSERKLFVEKKHEYLINQISFGIYNFRKYNNFDIIVIKKKCKYLSKYPFTFDNFHKILIK